MQNLEKNGYLSNIRAQIRSSVFKTIDSQEGSSKKVCRPILRLLPSTPITSRFKNQLRAVRGRTPFNSFRNYSSFMRWNTPSKSSLRSQTQKTKSKDKNWQPTTQLSRAMTNPYSTVSLPIFCQKQKKNLRFRRKRKKPKCLYR